MMEILSMAVVVMALLFIGKSAYGWAAGALIIAAFMLWWDGQPGSSIGPDL